MSSPEKKRQRRASGDSLDDLFESLLGGSPCPMDVNDEAVPNSPTLSTNQETMTIGALRDHTYAASGSNLIANIYIVYCIF